MPSAGAISSFRSSSPLQWLGLVAAIWLQSISGTNFNFPAYSSQLKILLSMSQLQLNDLAFASDAGKLFGWVSGIAARRLPLWLVLLIGAALGLIGYGLQFLFLMGTIHSLSYWQAFLLCTLAGNSICWINTVSYIVAIRNFPANRQAAAGIATSFQGLSAKIFTAIVEAAMVNPNNYGALPAVLEVERAKSYLFLSACLPLLVCIVSAPFLTNNDTDRAGSKRERGFVIMFVITIATGIFAVVSSLGSVSSAVPALGEVIGLGIFLLAPLAVPLVAKIGQIVRRKRILLDSDRKRVHVIVQDDDIIIEEVSNSEVKGGPEEAAADVSGGEGREEENVGAVKEEIGLKLMLQRVDFWLYFFVYLFGATIGLVFLNNLGQIAESRGFPGTAQLVSLSSSFGFFGRLLPSVLDYFFSGNPYMISRPAFIATLMAPMCGAFFCLLHNSNEALYVSTAVIGVCTGAITSMAVSVTTELFGTKNFGVNHNVVVANIPIGSFVFGLLAAAVYRRGGSSSGRCMGPECYGETFLVWGSLCVIGNILAIILYARTRKFYSQKL